MGHPQHFLLVERTAAPSTPLGMTIFAPPDFLLRFVGSTCFMRFSLRENRTRGYQMAQRSRKSGYAQIEMTKGRTNASLNICLIGY